MGRKRKVPPGLKLKNWCNSFDESSSDDEKCTQLPSLVARQNILRQDLSPGQSTAPSSASDILISCTDARRYTVPIKQLRHHNSPAENEPPVAQPTESDNGDNLTWHSDSKIN